MVVPPSSQPPSLHLRSMEDYRASYSPMPEGELSKGQFGTVQLVLGPGGSSYATKVLPCTTPAHWVRALREVDLMAGLEHLRVVAMVECFRGEEEVVVVMEHLAGGQLFDLVVEEGFALTEGRCRTFVRQICEGLAYLHSLSIVHLDLKPENIVCVGREKCSVKIVDFGSAQRVVPGLPVLVEQATPEFAPPEVVTGGDVGVQADMWSLGVICYVLLSGCEPFVGESEQDTFANIAAVRFDFEEEELDAVSQEAKQFITCLLLARPHHRMSADACLHHPWLQGPGAFVVLPTGALRRWVARRRWRGVGRAIGAVKRMTGLVGRRRAATQPSPPARTQPPASSPRPASTCSGTHNLYEGENCDTGERSSQWPTDLSPPGSLYSSTRAIHYQEAARKYPLLCKTVSQVVRFRCESQAKDLAKASQPSLFPAGSLVRLDSLAARRQGGFSRNSSATLLDSRTSSCLLLAPRSRAPMPPGTQGPPGSLFHLDRLDTNLRKR